MRPQKNASDSLADRVATIVGQTLPNTTLAAKGARSTRATGKSRSTSGPGNESHSHPEVHPEVSEEKLRVEVLAVAPSTEVDGDAGYGDELAFSYVRAGLYERFVYETNGSHQAIPMIDAYEHIASNLACKAHDSRGAGVDGLTGGGVVLQATVARPKPMLWRTEWIDYWSLDRRRMRPVGFSRIDLDGGGLLSEQRCCRRRPDEKRENECSRSKFRCSHWKELSCWFGGGRSSYRSISSKMTTPRPRRVCIRWKQGASGGATPTWCGSDTRDSRLPVSYTHLTLPTIYSV